MKRLLVLIVLLSISFTLLSQNTFKLGYTGAYPTFYDTSTRNINWGFYSDLKLNTIQGWWIGDNPFGLEVFDKLDDNNIDGFFQPDSLRWAAYGRMQVMRAASTTGRFRFTGRWCGSSVTDNSQFGSGQTVMYYDKNGSCPNQSSGGLILYNVDENGFQSFSALPSDPKYQIHFPGDGASNPGYLNRYYVKPRIRIDSTEADGSAKNVVRIIIKAYDGTIDSVTIITDDFEDGTGNYNGQYLEEFNLSILGDAINSGRPSSDPVNLSSCQVDYQIYWYGDVSVWIDYVKVMDEVANKLFNTNSNENLDSMIAGKISRLDATDTDDRMKGFYMEEIDYSNLACLQKMNEKLALYSDNDADYKMIGLINPHTYRGHLKTWLSTDYADYADMVNPPVYMLVYYPFTGSACTTGAKPILPSNISYVSQSHYPSYVNSEVPTYWQTDDYADYTYDVQYGKYTPYGYYVDTLKSIASGEGKPLYVVPQVIFWHEKNSGFTMREPMNSEIGTLFTVAICHGAKGILPYAYESWTNSTPLPYIKGGTYEQYTSSGCTSSAGYSFGMSDFTTDTSWGVRKRLYNFYGEPKWDYVKTLNEKILTWSPVIVNSTSTTGYNIQWNGFGSSYITDIKSIYRDASTPFAFTGSNTDAQLYWELGFFTPDNVPENDKSKFFMMVNRRTVPEVAGGDGDIRQLKIQFSSSLLTGFRNWKLTDIYARQSVIFDKNNQGSDGFVNLGSTQGTPGYFNPGEGKLFKLEPVMQGGGIIVADEDVSGQTFTCEDTVLNNGYNITIDSGTTVSFTDSATIIMTGGTFTSGVHGEDNLTTYKGLSSANWNGLRFEGTTVKIYNSKFQDIASPIVNYAVSMVDCPLADIRTNEFILDTDTAGAVQSVYIEPASPGPVSADLYINYNTITMNQSRGNGISVQGFSALTLPVYIMNNTMSSEGYATGLMLSTITGGAVKKNTITGFSTGVNVLFSSVDFYGNIISNTSSGSKGIMASGSTSLGLVPVSGLWLGGFNEITNTSGTSTNIEVDNSIFILDGGNNSFDISTGNNHLYGSFWDDAYPTNHRYNCFSVSGTDISSPTLPNDFISSGESEDVTLTYLAYTCGGTPPSGTYIADIGNGLYDTIQSSSEGPGGGGVPMSNEQLSISNKKSKANQKQVEQTFLSVYTLTASQREDSARVNMRKRNYQNVKTFCTELINNYPSSHEALSSLQPLYISWMAVDTTQSGVTALKTFYETLILNNGSNTSLVRISNYLVQKCKVSLGSYSSALSGFGQIINNNPYSYEGLLARWDYMATSLLAPQGGAISNEQLSMNNFQFDESYESYKSYESDGPFTKEQKQDIYKSVTTAFEITRNDDEAKIKALEVSSENGNESAANELHHMKALKEIVKTERPKTMTEHIRTVSSDLQKVFGSTAPVSNIKGSNIPVVFSLSQNYPNPFNPVTTIKYALPKDVKVVVKIYDILGREVRTLVNEFRKAGYYDVKFDMSSYASGVYFYRIEAGDFVQSKKMVLVK